MRLLWTNHTFGAVAIAQLISLIGDFISGIAWIWYLTDRPNSASSIALVLAAFTVPQAILPILAGHLADSLDPRKLLLVGELGNALVTLSIATAMRADRLSIPAFCVAAFLLGITGGLLGPTYSVVLLGLVEHDQMLDLSVVRQGAMNLAWVIGPFLGGLAVARLGPAGAIYLDAGTFLVVVATILVLWSRHRLPGKQEPPDTHETEDGFWVGWRFLKAAPGLLIIVLVYALSNALNNVESVLVPEIARGDLGLGAVPFSLLATTMATGGILGTAYMSRRAGSARTFTSYIRGSLAVFGIAILLMGLVNAGWQLYPLYLAFGFTFAMGEVANSTVFQERIPVNLRGRVFGTIGSLAASLNPAGYLLAGAVGSAIGGRPTIVIAGATIALVALWQLSRTSVQSVLERTSE